MYVNDICMYMYVYVCARMYMRLYVLVMCVRMDVWMYVHSDAHARGVD